jgi:aminoacylase
VALKLGDVATLNLTALEGGVKSADGKQFALNVIPTDAMAGFDIRLPPSLPLEKFESMLKEWTKAEGVTYEFVYKTEEHHVSNIDRKNNKFWVTKDPQANPISQCNPYKITMCKRWALTLRDPSLTMSCNACPTQAAFEDCISKDLKMELQTEIFPAGTDGRYIRSLGIPVYGFSPMAETPILLHEHDESLHKDTYLKGIKAYEAIIPALANA